MNALFPAKTGILFNPAPYKVLYGGRGSGKTWSLCRALLILGSQIPLFILCARELQKSIAESVHRTLSTQIDPLGLGKIYRVMEHKIISEEFLNPNTGKMGRTEIVFAGIKSNISAIKSMEGIDVCAVFEANGVSAHSWETLLPTIRRDAPHGPFGTGSEIWIEFNPELGTDETYKRWVLNPPPGTVMREINWRDNEWFPSFSNAQKEDMRKKDYENYLTIWEGKVRRVVRGAIYAKELEAAASAGRIGPHVLVERSKPVNVSADLGRADTCALWFSQQVGLEHRFIDYYSGFGHDWTHYLEQIQARKYMIGRIYLPHDADAKLLAAKKSISAQTRDFYPNRGQVTVVPRTPSVVNDINAVRMLFSRFFFNEEKCKDGLQALAHYKYDIDEETREVSQKPLHDWASHAADALRYYAMGLGVSGGDRHARAQIHQPPAGVQPGSVPRGLGWMG